MRALTILRKDLVQVFRDRRALVFLVLMPLTFTLFFGLAFSGIGDTSHDARLQIGFVDADGGPTSARLFAWLAASDAVRPERLDARMAAVAADLVRRGDDAAVVRVPEGWGAAHEAGAAPTLEVVADTGSSSGLAAVGAVEAALGRFLSAERAARLAAELVAARSAVAPDAVQARALELARTAWSAPPLRVAAATGSAPEADAPTASARGFGSNPYDQASPGMIVQFAVYGLLLSATVLVIERRQGAHRRLLTTPTSRTAVVAGHALAMFVVVLGQILVLEAFGQLAFGVAYLQHPGATLALSLALALWSASLGMLLGAFAHDEQQVVAIGLLAMFLFSGLGGAWFPLEITGRTFAAVGHLTPTAWAMDAYRAILLRGAGLAEVLPSLLVLLGFALAFSALAVLRLRRVAS